MTDVLAAALSYTWQRVPVFPCDPRTKQPYCARGFYAADTDPEHIRAWWRQLPDAMIGMPTGPSSGLWVLDVDVDVDNGIDGATTLRELIAASGVPLPATRISATPRGGTQYFFRWTGKPIRNSASRIGRGLDVRGAGGYVILPPSIRSDGTPYRWLNTLLPADAPAWLIEAALCSSHDDHPRRAVGSVNGNGTPYTRVSPRTHAWAQAALRIACERIASAGAGTRNSTLNNEASAIPHRCSGNDRWGSIQPARAGGRALTGRDYRGLRTLHLSVSH